jgi:hypothetical protein
MDYSEEIQQDLKKFTTDINPMAIEVIRMSERVIIFEKLRRLIHEKDYQNDQIASAILGWAYERLAED